MSLATYYNDRYEQTNSASDFDVAIQWSQQALDALPEDHHDRGKIFNTIGNIHYQRYKKTALVSDVDKCIGLIQKALDVTPDTDKGTQDTFNFWQQPIMTDTGSQ